MFSRVSLFISLFFFFIKILSNRLRRRSRTVQCSCFMHNMLCWHTIYPSRWCASIHTHTCTRCIALRYLSWNLGSTSQSQRTHIVGTRNMDSWIRYSVIKFTEWFLGQQKNTRCSLSLYIWRSTHAIICVYSRRNGDNNKIAATMPTGELVS